MTTVEAAEYVGLAEAELLDLHARGAVPGVLVGGRLLFRRGDLSTVGRRLRPSTGTTRPKAPKRRIRKSPALRRDQ